MVDSTKGARKPSRAERRAARRAAAGDADEALDADGEEEEDVAAARAHRGGSEDDGPWESCGGICAVVVSFPTIHLLHQEL